LTADTYGGVHVFGAAARENLDGMKWLLTQVLEDEPYLICISMSGVFVEGVGMHPTHPLHNRARAGPERF